MESKPKRVKVPHEMVMFRKKRRTMRTVEDARTIRKANTL